MINYGKQYIDEDDIFEVVETLKSNYLTTGPKVEEFENKLCEFTGYNYAVAVNSGTAALHCALFAAGIEKDDEVIVPAMTFIATANAILYQGGIPVFADIDKNTLLIDCDNVETLITEKTKAIIAVDYAGQQCDYRRLKEICDKYNLILISDACHSLGCVAAVNNNKVADFTYYSFHPVKHITTGEGGAILCDRKFKSSVMKAFRNHGRYNGSDAFTLGYNYRMPDINAALGISQMDKLNQFLLRRKQISILYRYELEYCSLKQIHNNHSYHLFVIKVKNRKLFIRQMKDSGINCTVHYIPVYDHPFYKGYMDEAKINCKNTEKIKDNIVSLPIYYGLSDEDVKKVIELVKKFNPKGE
jgi:dTDP-4-amino-4,6-dideoxygalactose transaminase